MNGWMAGTGWDQDFGSVEKSQWKNTYKLIMSLKLARYEEVFGDFVILIFLIDHFLVKSPG